MAERVVTIKELKRYVDRNWPDPGPLPDQWSKVVKEQKRDWVRTFTAQRIRYLLARRLTRVGRWREARKYYPPNLRLQLDDYVQAIRRGHNKRLPEAERAAAFWEAGDIARYHGEALLEIEIETGWMIWGNHYEMDRTSKVRLKKDRSQRLGSTPDERRRVERHTNEAGYHYHYKYVAIGHYLSALAYMPDESDDTARRLCEIGSWIAPRDPQAADVFYKALVWRCWSTPLARAADRKRWFPPCGPEPGPTGATP